MIKKVQVQRMYDVSDRIKWLATNFDGALVGFIHPPVRDYEREEWVDSVTGESGELIVAPLWDTFCREVDTLEDMALRFNGIKKW